MTNDFLAQRYVHGVKLCGSLLNPAFQVVFGLDGRQFCDLPLGHVHEGQHHAGDAVVRRAVWQETRQEVEPAAVLDFPLDGDEL
ncbi:MAG: hypothetical protein K0R38_82 [Polyangiaceae bacterium]|jgi:hypothetical protein|nr:hypothetical protein [Polyangiaceae bacterium]